MNVCHVDSVYRYHSHNHDRHSIFTSEDFSFPFLSALSVDPMVLGPEISGRLLPHYSKFPNIARLIDSCDLHAQRDCPFVATWQSYTSPGGPLQYVCGADPGVNSEVIYIYFPYLKLTRIRN